jgi:hypothetical protein
MTTTTQRFVYRQRSRESVEHVKRLHKWDRDWDKAMRLAYHGEPARLCALARAAPRLRKSEIDDLVDLIERGRKFLSRGAPTLDKRTELKQRILAIVRKREERLRAGGRLPYGARPRLIARAMGELSEELNELDHRSQTPSETTAPNLPPKSAKSLTAVEIPAAKHAQDTRTMSRLRRAHRSHGLRY